MDTEKPETIGKAPTIEKHLARELQGVDVAALDAALKLHASGTAVPAIANFHANDVKGLSEATIYSALDEVQEFQETEKLRAHILQEVKAQGSLTPELESRITTTWNRLVLDDLYLPFKLKGRTTATIAKEAGLTPLADWIWGVGHGTVDAGDVTLEKKAEEFIKVDQGIADAESALQGASAILVERISESAELRGLVRASLLRKSKIRSEKGSKAKDKSKFARFFQYREPIGSLKRPASAQRYLLMRKGWAANELVLAFERADEAQLAEAFATFAAAANETPAKELLQKAARTALHSSVFTVMEHEAHKLLKEKAENYLIDALMKGLEKRLWQAPLGAKKVLGIDPGGEGKPASLALVDEQGNLLVHNTVSLESDEAWNAFQGEFAESLARIGVQAVAILHGPQGKLARRRLTTLLSEKGMTSPVVMIYEQSATIYSTSSVAKEELPDMDPGVRRAAFAARILQDPLRELVKVDPKFLVAHAFQFDIQSNRLGKALYRSIQTIVCRVGVDLNTASRSLLAYLPGFDHEIAKAVVAHRKSRGPFKAIGDLAQVSAVSSKVLSESRGFLRLSESSDAWERTGLPQELKVTVTEALGETSLESLDAAKLEALRTDANFLEKLGEKQAKRVLTRLSWLVNDPRGEYQPFAFELQGVPFAEIKTDIQVGGIVTNITNFGVFVDIGVEQDGLVHISELSDGSNPVEEVVIGDEARVWIAALNTQKNQISLSLRTPDERKRRRPERGARAGAERPRRGKRPAEGEAAAAPKPSRPRPTTDVKPVAAGEPVKIIGAASAPEKDERDSRGGDGKRGGGDKKKTTQRDPKTGALMKLDDSIYTSQKPKRGERGGDRFASKAKPATFNPFAKLGDILKNDQKGE